MQEPEDRDEDDQESALYFSVNKTFNYLVDFIYKEYQDSRPHSDPSVPPRCEFESFCGFSDHPHRGDLSLGFCRYPVSALHPQALVEAPEPTQAVQATQSANCHSSRLCVSSGHRPSMNALVP